MLSLNKRLSELFILSQLVMATHQQCLGTPKLGDSSYTFTLPQVNDNINRNPTAAQEACYYGCGAQIVTQSSYQGDMSQLTLMDNAASALRAAGFLKNGQSYILNHLGMQAEEGDNGIGCIQLSENKFNHYPKEHPVCAQAKVAVCGFWGQQAIPTKPSPKPVPTATTSIVPSATFAATTISTRPRTSTSLTRPASSSTAQAVQNVFSSTDVISSITITPTAATQPLENGVVHQFDAYGHKYHVIKKQASDSSLVVQAHSVCRQTLGSNISGITSAGYEAVTSQLQISPFANSKLIIGSWNGDSYSMSGRDCLILQVNSGIYPGQCSEASAILCQS